jgi:hypothetical protein
MTTASPVECRTSQEILSLKKDQPCKKKKKNTLNKRIEIRVDVGTIAEPR